MNLSHRRATFLVFLVIFIFVAALIVLYAMGWRFNCQNRSFNKVGALFISTTPPNLQVYLNNKLFTTKTPYTINNLLPNIYTLRLTKNNYNDWESTVHVSQSGLVRLNNIYLIKKISNPIKIFNGPYKAAFKISNNKIAAFDGVNMTIYDVMNENVDLKLPFDQIPIEVITNSASKDFIAKLENNIYYDINPETNKIFNINENYKISPQWLSFNTTDSNSFIYSDALKTYSLESGNIQKVISPIPTLYSNGDIAVSKQDDKIVVTKNDTTINSITSTTLLNPFVKEISDSLIYITSSNSSSGIFYHLQENQLIPWDHEFSSAALGVDNQMLLITNQTEIWQLDLKHQTEQLLNRTSLSITSSSWLIKNQYFYYFDTNGILQIIGLNENSSNSYQSSFPGVTNSISFENSQKIIVLTENDLSVISY